MINPFLCSEEPNQIFDLVVSTILHASRVGHLNRTISDAKGLLALLRRLSPPPTDADLPSKAQEAAMTGLTLRGQTLAESLVVQRHYVVEGGNSQERQELQYDPHYLLFEFTHNIVLRKAQVELIQEFVESLRCGRPLVKQMLMGGGKTTVVGPMLALLLADGKTLVVQTMPLALLEQSKATLRATFSSIIRKCEPISSFIQW